MTVKPTDLQGQITGYFHKGRTSLINRLQRTATNNIWLIINKRVASTLTLEKVYGIKNATTNFYDTGKAKIQNNILARMITNSRTYLPESYYVIYTNMVRLIKDISPADFNWKRRYKMANVKELSFTIDELVEFIYNLRQGQEYYWWVGVYEPQASQASMVCTSLRGFFDGKLWMPVPDELGNTCCSELLQNAEELKDESKREFDPFILMKHCTEHEHIRQMLLNRTIEDLQAEYRYMLEITMQALAENI